MGEIIKFSIALIFQSNMVIQREKAVPVWGCGPSGAVVSIEIQNIKIQTTVMNDEWMIRLPPLQTSFNETMVITCMNENKVLENICIGEVWIAGGQSNMEFFVRYDEDRNNIFEYGQNKNIRFFDYPRISYEGALSDRDYSLYGLWRNCDSSNLEYFSAVGYHFAQKLEKDLGVPVGIIGCNWGGTPACAWIKQDYLEETDGRIWIDEYKNATSTLDFEEYDRKFIDNPKNFKTDIFSDEIGEKLMFGMTKEQQEVFMQSPEYFENLIVIGPKDPNRPGGLYETMLMKIVPYAVRGFIWYQGESDDKHAQLYDIVLSALISSWRELWKEELPFLFVQLAPFRKWLDCLGERYPILREKQELVSRNVPKVWMVSIMDSGMEWDIHPKKKKPVGERLALLAEGKVYLKNILCESPEVKDLELVEDKIIISFEHADDGLYMKGREINSLVCICNNIPLENHRAVIDGSQIIITSKEIKNCSSIEIKFAYTDFCEVNVFNLAGLPVRPFIWKLNNSNKE